MTNIETKNGFTLIFSKYEFEVYFKYWVNGILLQNETTNKIVFLLLYFNLPQKIRCNNMQCPKINFPF